MQEPWIKATIITPDEHLGSVLTLCQERRGQQVELTYAGTRGSNLRLSEFQGNLLVAQMTRVIEQTNRRTENAKYLTQLLNEIPGIKTAKMYDDLQDLKVKYGLITPEQYAKFNGKYLHQQWRNADDLAQFHADIGRFQGVMTPITPNGSLRVKLWNPAPRSKVSPPTALITSP